MEKTNYYHVYAYLDPRKRGLYKFGNYIFDNEPIYIGKGKDGSKRANKHLTLIKSKNVDVTNNQYKLHVINQILIEGEEPIIVKIISGINEKIAYDIETLLIELIGCRFNNTGTLTNLMSGGLGGDTFTNNPRKEEIREKHKKNATGENNHMFGLALEKRPSHIAKINGHHWNTGRKASNETKALMSENNSGSGNPRAKSVIKCDLNGIELDSYSTMKKAAELNNIKYKSSIGRACVNNGTAGGFRWKIKN